MQEYLLIIIIFFFKKNIYINIVRISIKFLKLNLYIYKYIYIFFFIIIFILSINSKKKFFFFKTYCGYIFNLALLVCVNLHKINLEALFISGPPVYSGKYLSNGYQYFKKI